MGIIRSKIGKLIAEKAHREHRKITQNEVADAINIAPQTLSKMMWTDNYTIKARHLVRLCEYFDCGIGDVLEYVQDEELGG